MSDDRQPENGEIPGGEAQLSSPAGVRNDMGTLALEGIPRERLARPSPSPGATTAGMGALSDAEIMRRAGAGDEACFESLVTKYRRPIVGFMVRMVHNQAIAEELAQEVFLRVYRARASYRAEARFTTWLYRIAVNTAINHARGARRERASSSLPLDHPEETGGIRLEVADRRPGAEERMLREERLRQIRERIAALPERQRAAVTMHKYQEMDYRQIGEVLKLSESATKSLLFRAYQTLRGQLREFVRDEL